MSTQPRLYYNSPEVPSISARSWETTRSITPPESAPFPLWVTRKGFNSMNTDLTKTEEIHEAGIGFPVRSLRTNLPVRCQRVQLVKENHAWCCLGSSFEHLAYIPFALSYVHVDELWTFDGKKRQTAMAAYTQTSGHLQHSSMEHLPAISPALGCNCLCQ